MKVYVLVQSFAATPVIGAYASMEAAVAAAPKGVEWITGPRMSVGHREISPTASIMYMATEEEVNR